MAPGLYGNEPTNWFASGITPGISNALNLPPVCTLVSPTNGAAFTVPATIVLTATAADPDGTISRVEYYEGDVKLGEASSPPFAFTWSNVREGGHTIVAKARDNGLAVSVSDTVTFTVAPPPVGHGVGLKAQIYDNADFTGLMVVRTNPVVNFDWGGGSPDPAIGADTFSVRWTGLVQPRFSETYTFYTVSDDGVRLWVDDQLLVDNWTDHGATENSGTLALEAGMYYPIKMEMYENGGGAVAELFWSSPTVAKEVIPQAQLYPYQSVYPSIVAQPASQTVGLGSNATFQVVVDNSPTSYQWLLDGKSMMGQTTDRLVITNAGYADEGAYRVTVCNSYGCVTSSPAYLTVVEPPVITAQPQDLAGQVGGSAVFSVGMDGSAPFYYQWQFYGTNLPGANSASLTLSNLRYNQAGPYDVWITNAGGVTLSRMAQLSITGPLTILTQPKSASLGPVTNVVTTSNVLFTVGAIGQGLLTYQWTLWGTNLPGATNGSLQLSNVSLDVSGPYAVRVADTVSTVTSSNAQLTLLVRPVIYVYIQPQSVVYGGTASLSVWAGPVHPSLPLSYRWNKNGTFFITNNQPTLILSNLTTSDNYLVTVANPAGIISKGYVTLTVLPDTDRDGLPDELELAMNYPVTNSQDGAWDYDQDGMSNAAEVAAGTDPKDRASVFRLVSTNRALGESSLRFSFTAVSNRTYSVEYRDTLEGTGWTNLLSLDSLPTNRLIWVTDQPPAAVWRRYYRAKTPRDL
jgi:hypothetical protein